MRTNIVLDDDLIQRAQALTGLKTKKDVVHEALVTLVRLRDKSKPGICAGNSIGRET